VSGALFVVASAALPAGCVLELAGVIAAPALAPSFFDLVSLPLGSRSVEPHVRFVEEPFLARTHGEPYARYCRRLGRFLPAVGRAR